MRQSQSEAFRVFAVMTSSSVACPEMTMDTIDEISASFLERAVQRHEPDDGLQVGTSCALRSWSITAHRFAFQSVLAGLSPSIILEIATR